MNNGKRGQAAAAWISSFSFAALAAFCLSVPLAAQWNEFAHDQQHSAESPVTAQILSKIRWQTPVDLKPQYSQGDLLIHYGSPLVTAANTVVVPVKTGATGGFAVEAHASADGTLVWRQTTDYILPTGNFWTPVFGPALTSTSRLYYPGAGGTVYYIDSADAGGPNVQLAFYGLAKYTANAQAFNANVKINTPLTTDSAGNIYFGFLVNKNNIPLRDNNGTILGSGIAKIGSDGTAAWTTVTAASNDKTMTQVVYNCAPAVSADGATVYVAVSDGAAGYLVSLDGTSLKPLGRVRLKDPKSGRDALLSNSGSASPTVGPGDGDVYYGVLEYPCCKENHDRGWLLHFDKTLKHVKTPGAFGWDDTAAVVPKASVPSYTGSSPYLLATKYNNYADPGAGGNGLNKLAILDPNNLTEIDPVTGVTTMDEVETVLGPTANTKLPGVKEWCINSAAVDVGGKAVVVGSEDGKLYRWDLVLNTLTESIVLTPGIGEAYTPTVIGPDGMVYAINNATLFAVGQ